MRKTKDLVDHSTDNAKGSLMVWPQRRRGYLEDMGAKDCTKMEGHSHNQSLVDGSKCKQGSGFGMFSGVVEMELSRSMLPLSQYSSGYMRCGC